MNQKYIYGIVPFNGESTFGPIGLGIGSREVYTVTHRGLGCVISDYQGKEFQAMAKEELMRSLMTHQAVIETIMKRYPVLPVKFGTLLVGSENVRHFLEQGYHQLKTALQLIRDKVEVEIAATWDLGKVLQEIGSEEEIIRLKEQVLDKPVEETLEQRIQVGKRVKELLDQRRDSYRSRMIGFLKDMALDVQPNALLSDEMVLNVAFLIDRTREEDFVCRVEELDVLLHGEIVFRIIDPLPPYSFSTIEIASPNTNKLEEARHLLGLGDAISETEVKEAYRRLGARIHPDHNHGDEQAGQRFAKLHEASALLLAYCRGTRDNRHGHAKEERYPLAPGRDAFLISLKRSAAREDQEAAALAI